MLYRDGFFLLYLPAHFTNYDSVLFILSLQRSAVHGTFFVACLLNIKSWNNTS